MEVHLSPAVLALIAVLSVGGLMLLGVQAQIVGKVSDAPYMACCTASTWQQGPTGFIQGQADTSTVVCAMGEDVSRCCMRNALQGADLPVRLLGARPGQCRASPAVAYPVFIR